MNDTERNNYNKFLIALAVLLVSVFLSGFFTGKALAAEVTTYGNISDYTDSTYVNGIYTVDDTSDPTYSYHYIQVYNNQVVYQESDSKYYVPSPTKTYFKVYKATINKTTHVITTPWAKVSDTNTTYDVVITGTFVASNRNIYKATYDSGTSTWTVSSTVFFSNLTGLAKLVQPLQLSQVLLQVQLLLPILILVVVGFLGLRKALAILRQILQQA